MAVYLGSNQVSMLGGKPSSSNASRALKNQINFIDYDGVILYSYTADEINAMVDESDLPPNPLHDGLVAQGWNWTLAQIKAQLTAIPNENIWVGQMYMTKSENTEIDIEMQDGRLSPYMSLAVKGSVSIDWGDGTTPDIVTGTSLTSRTNIQHTYSLKGKYTIVISINSGSWSFYGSSTYFLLYKNATANQNRVYTNCIQAIRIGKNTVIGNYAFFYCCSLSSITIPKTVTSIGNNAFEYCFSLLSVTIPNTVTSIGNYTFGYCYSLSNIAMPSIVTSIGIYAFEYCHSLSSVTIPNSVTALEGYAFAYCYSLSSITIPNLITSIRNYTFHSCYSLTSITIPNSVTSIGNNAFYYCYGMAEYHIKPTTIPTLGTSAFNGIASDCIIYVPSAKLTDYQSAKNWSTYASYMQGE